MKKSAGEAHHMLSNAGTQDAIGDRMSLEWFHRLNNDDCNMENWYSGGGGYVF